MTKAAKEWVADLESHINRAKELGLLRQPIPANPTREVLLGILDEVVARTDFTLEVTSEAIGNAAKMLSTLEAEEAQHNKTLGGLKRRLVEMERVKTSSEAYGDGLRIQRDRLQIASWLNSRHTDHAQCPICGQGMADPTPQLLRLTDSITQIERTVKQTADVPAIFDRELLQVRSEIDEQTASLRSIQARRSQLSKQSQDARDYQFRLQDANRFVGGLEHALLLHRRVAVDSTVASEINMLRNNVEQLSRELLVLGIDQKKERALTIINSNAGKLLPFLDTERPNDPISLEPEELTIKVIGADRADYLHEIGSGSNFLAYHVAMLLGLHQCFLTLRQSPVPSLLVIDQPSQVYFPKKLVVKNDEEPPEPTFTDEDVAAVRKTYAVVGDVVTQALGRLQAIVLDHAPQSVWENLPGVTMVEEWRDGRKLIPVEWLPLSDSAVTKDGHGPTP